MAEREEKEMMEWIRKNDIITKTIAGFIAIFLWFYVIAEQNPEISVPFSSIPVQIEGVQELTAQGLSITEGANSLVSVKLTGRRNRMQKVKPDKIMASASVSNITSPGDYTINYYIRVDVPEVVTSSKTPNQLRITVDRILSVSVPVKIDLKGFPAEEYQLNKYTLSPDAITVTGPERILETIDRAAISYDITDAMTSVETVLTYTLLDKNGDPVDTSMLSFDTPSVGLSAIVNKAGTVPLTVTLTGNEYISHSDVKYTIEPAKISVSGNPDAVNILNQVDLGSLNIDNMIKNGIKSVTLPIILPNGVTADQGTPETATITVDFPEHESRLYEISNEQFPIITDFEYPEQKLDLLLFGKSEELDLLAPDNFVIELDYAPEALVQGQNIIPVKISVRSSKVTVIGKYTVTVTIRELPDIPIVPIEPIPPIVEGDETP